MLQVVKVGGSLISAPGLVDPSGNGLGSWASRLLQWQRQTCADYKTIYIAGGGDFANEVRSRQAEWKLSDATAHDVCMSLLAATATIAAACLEKRVVQPAAVQAALLELLPGDGVVLNLTSIYQQWELDLPQDWSVTTDTLAAVVAARLHADRLVLVKSTELTADQPQVMADVGLVDTHFPSVAPLLAESGYQIGWLNLLAEEPELVTIQNLTKTLPPAAG